MPRLPEAMVRRLVDVDGRRHVAMVAVVEGECVGIASYVALADEPGAAEVGACVTDQYQGRGIGRLLVQALRPVAVRAGLTSLVYLADPTNRPALGLLSLDVELAFHDGLVEGRQQLSPGRRTSAPTRRAPKPGSDPTDQRGASSVRERPWQSVVCDGRLERLRPGDRQGGAGTRRPPRRHRSRPRCPQAPGGEDRSRAVALALDITDADAAREAVDKAVSHFGRVDVVVNNAGFAHVGAVEELSDQEWRQLVETDLFGAITSPGRPCRTYADSGPVTRFRCRR
jgi:GNAT superfamily N-acetyltransferase